MPICNVFLQNHQFFYQNGLTWSYAFWFAYMWFYNKLLLFERISFADYFHNLQQIQFTAIIFSKSPNFTPKMYWPYNSLIWRFKKLLIFEVISFEDFIHNSNIYNKSSFQRVFNKITNFYPKNGLVWLNAF